MAQFRCPRCGREYFEYFRFCPDCGQPGLQQISGPQPEPRSPYYERPKKRGNNTVWIVALVVLLVLALGVIALFVFDPLNKKGDSNETTIVSNERVEPVSATPEPAPYTRANTKPSPSRSYARSQSGTPAAIVINGKGVRFRFAPSFGADWLKLRSGRHAGHAKSVSKGTALPYSGYEDAEWYGVIYDGSVYYVSKQYSYPIY